jgi:hypothetical protein
MKGKRDVAVHVHIREDSHHFFTVCVCRGATGKKKVETSSRRSGRVLRKEKRWREKREEREVFLSIGVTLCKDNNRKLRGKVV